MNKNTLRVLDSVSDASDAVVFAALQMQLNASWGGWGPCKIEITRLDTRCAHYQIRMGSDWAVTFEVLGVRFGSFRDRFTAEKFRNLLRQHRYYSEPSTPNSDTSHVYLGLPTNADDTRETISAAELTSAAGIADVGGGDAVEDSDAIYD